MGWSYVVSHGRSAIDILKSTYATENHNGKWQWLDHSTRGNTIYAVLKFTPKGEHADTTYQPDADGSYRFVVVFQTRRCRDEYNFGYRADEESVGPYLKNCPERLLKSASAFRDDYTGYGREWRAACRANRIAARQCNATRPKPGQTFRTAKPVKFRDGREHSVFTCTTVSRRGRNTTVYRAEGCGTLYRFRPEREGFELCAPSATVRQPDLQIECS